MAKKTPKPKTNSRFGQWTVPEGAVIKDGAVCRGDTDELIGLQDSKQRTNHIKERRGKLKETP